MVATVAVILVGELTQFPRHLQRLYHTILELQESRNSGLATQIAWIAHALMQSIDLCMSPENEWGILSQFQSDCDSNLRISENSVPVRTDKGMNTYDTERYLIRSLIPIGAGPSALGHRFEASCMMQGISSTYSIGILRILLDSDWQFRITRKSLSNTLSCT